MEMAEPEKVIKGLRCLSNPYIQDIDERDCENCKYDNASCFLDVTADALSLLNAQEPRVMTLEELYLAEHKGVYLERRNSKLYSTEPVIVIKAERCYIQSIGNGYIFMRENKLHDKYWGCDYNKKWRCWTARPTDAQREAISWEEK